MKCPKCGGKMDLYDSRKLDKDNKRVKPPNEPVMTLRRYQCIDCDYSKKTTEDLI